MDISTTYNNTQELQETTGLINFQKLLRRQGSSYSPGICKWCCALTTSLHKLQRCQGCQLVAYCGRDCQRNDWGSHKVLCKEFPAKDGKSILVLAQEKTISKTISNVASEKELEAHANFMFKHIEQVQKLHADQFVLKSPRICKICCEARPNKLFDCVCCSEVYCSETHRNKDKLHLKLCEGMHRNMKVGALLAKHDSILKLPCILKEEIKIGNNPVDYKHLDDLRLKLIHQLESEFQECHIDYEEYKVLVGGLQNNIINRLSFPLTIHHVLQRLGVGDERKPLREVTRLNIHVLTEIPLVDSSIWEYFMHMIPNLKELHVTLVSHIYQNSQLFMKDIKLKRCKECEKKDRIIKYTIYKNHYHIFFSSKKYTTPDVVAVFSSQGPNKLQTPTKIHPEWQKITKNTKTFLILTDESEEALKIGVRQVELACYSDSMEKRLKSQFGKAFDEMYQLGKHFAEEDRVLKSLLPIQKNHLIYTNSVSCVGGSKFLDLAKYICCYQSHTALSDHANTFDERFDLKMQRNVQLRLAGQDVPSSFGFSSVMD